MAWTSTTCVFTVKSVTDLIINGIALKVINGKFANDAGTTKINFAEKGLPTKTGLPVVSPQNHSFTMLADGTQGSVPLVAGTISFAAT